MAVNPHDFVARPGFVNKQGCLPDPVELCCIQVPKVFDQCLIKRCLKPVDDPEQLCVEIPDITSEAQIKNIGCCRDFDVKINSVAKCPIKGQPGYKRVTVNFTVSFKVDVVVEVPDGSGGTKLETKTLDYNVAQTVTISKLYCPCAVAQISMSSTNGNSDDTEEIIKIEVISECLQTDVTTIDCDDDQNDEICLCITLGLFIIIKCELKVQLLIPAYGYCPVPDECPGSTEDPCEAFMQYEVPDFYPPQKMDNLFCDNYDE
jgi:hypothetical protein